ncbi:MAG: hypothetical protein IT361_10480 [Gemmatimonadaceae bacterium]|nr:hypothetical protein [Gemmatimonadaceae bacterium]
MRISSVLPDNNMQSTAASPRCPVWLTCALVLAPYAVPAVLHAQDASRVDVRVSATVLLNTFFTSTRTNNFDIPQVALRPSAADSLGEGGGVGLTVRQTRVGVHAFWPDVHGAEVRAEVDADFYGGQQQSGFGDLMPLLRVRRAIVDVAWDRASLLVGQEVPLIAEYNPLSFATVGLSGLSNSGNLWLWVPQLRGGVRLVRTEQLRLDVDAAIVGAGTNEPAGELLVQPDRAEQSNRPALQARAMLRWGTAERPGDVSVGLHRGWLATAGDSSLASSAVTAALRLPLGTRATFTGEAFTGQALTGLGGGGVGQFLGVNNVPVQTTGGWGQLVVELPRRVAVAGAWGMDDPDDNDLDASGRLRNVTTMGAVHWTPAPFIVALEVRRMTTTYRSGLRSGTHVNLAVGIGF